MRAWRRLAGLVALPWVVTACATAGNETAWIVPPDARTADQQHQDTAECATIAAHASGYSEDGSLRPGVLIGLVAGAAGGAALGAAIGAGVGHTTTGTIAGTVIGSAIGGVYAETRGAESYESVYHACLLARGYRIEERPAVPAPMQ